MAQTKLQDGNILDLTLASDVVSGGLIVQGKIVAVAQTIGLTGETISGEVCGIHRLPKATADDIAVGATIYAKGNEITSVATGAIKCGYAVVAAGVGILEIDIKLIPTC